MESIIVALISAVPATIAAVAAWRQVPKKTERFPDPPRPAAGAARRPAQRDVPLLKVAVIVVAGAVVAVSAGLAARLLLDGDGQLTIEDVAVYGTAQWTDTGVDISAGDDVEVTARGEVFHREDASIGPEGFTNRPDLLTPLPSANHAGLLGRAGTTGVPFYVGRDNTFTVERDGRLFLGINDGGLENNRGFFIATVTVRGE